MRDKLFPDQFFSDEGRRSVPPFVVAVVMVLQRLAGLSGREAVEHYAFDARWRYAAGVGGYDCGASGASPTPCWSTCAPGWRPPSVPGASSR